MDEYTPRCQPIERAQGTILAVDRHVTHAASGFLAGSVPYHLVIGEQRAVEQNDVGARKPLAHRIGSPPPHPAQI